MRTVETVRGRLATSKPLESQMSRGAPPLRLVIESGGEQIVVRLGPARGLKRIGLDQLNLAPGDEIVVTGSRQIGNGRQHVVIAATIAKGDQTIVLRDDSGDPAWLRPGRNPEGRPRRRNMRESADPGDSTRRNPMR